MPAPQVVVFDVNETLFDLAGLDPRFADVGLDPALRALWFARTLRDGFALAAAGDYRPFREVATATMRGLPGADSLGEDAVGAVLDGFAELEPHPDVEPALRALRAAGVRVVTLSVGSAELNRRQLDRAGLGDLVERTLSADGVRRWKPAPEPYRYAAAECGVPVDRMALVAVHSWDTHGATRAGLRAAWVSRLEGRRPESFGTPAVCADDLEDAVAQLLDA
jgi:2-haloacid dehalogenase